MDALALFAPTPAITPTVDAAAPTEVALEGASRHPIGSFRADRPALNDPTFEPAFRMKE